MAASSFVLSYSSGLNRGDNLPATFPCPRLPSRSWSPSFDPRRCKIPAGDSQKPRPSTARSQSADVAELLATSTSSPLLGKLRALLQPQFRKHKAVRVKAAGFFHLEISPWSFFHTCGPSQLHLSVRPCLIKVSAFGPTSDRHMDDTLKAGSPIIVVEAPPILKTAEPMPMLRSNSGLIKPGDAGRILSRKPKNVWAVRFAVGAYLIDRKYFKPLDIS